MGNEQSQPVSGQPRRSASESDAEEEEFDLSAIQDTRRGHSSPTRATASPSPTAETPSAKTAAMSRKRKKGVKPRANSKKKRKQSRDVEEEDDNGESGTNVVQQPPGEDGLDDSDDGEEARLAEELLLRERRRKVREEEPEMFDEYAMSEESNLQAEDARDVDGRVGGVARSEQEEEAVNGLDNGAEASGQDDAEMDGQEQADADGLQNGAEVDDEDDAESTEPEVEPASGKSPADEDEAQVVVEETPASKRRKRKQREDDSPTSSPKQKTIKRRKKADIPNTTDDLGDYGPVVELNPEATVVRQSKGSARRQSNMENYTQPLARGSELRHPVYNPESPVIARNKPGFAVVVPMSSAGPSRSNNQRASPFFGEDQEQSGSPPRSTNGLKRRPEGPLSPIKMRRDNQWDVQDQRDGPLQNGMAKSTARRTFAEAEDASDQDYQTAGAQSPEIKPSSNAKKRKKGKEPAQPKLRSTTPSRKKGPYAYRCPICNATYPTDKSLEKHRNDPTAHENLLSCEKCIEQFATKAGLARHEKQKGHGPGNAVKGKTGQFTTDEKNKLDLWRETFCDEHDVNHYEFNEMMTASGKMGNESWPYKFITRIEFRQEFYDVLPERNIRSMRRYRANFSNVDRSREFTEQDDEDILVLVAQLGQKWVDIGDQLTRDPEAIRQRWKNKLQFDVRGAKLKKGAWEEDERQRFDDAVKELRRATLSEGIKDVDSFNWAAVSLKVKTRTAPQCANHWRAMHGKNIKGLWVDSGMSQIMKPKSKSKMEIRLAGKKSKPRISDSDDEAADEGNGAEETADSDENSGPEEVEQDATQSDNEAYEEENGADPPIKVTPHKRRKPDIRQDRTPANGLSASQAFEQTQANTSEVKKSVKRRRRSEPSQEQPTPGIAVQVRPERSPEFGRKLDEALENPWSEAEFSGSELESDEEEDEPNNGEESEGQEQNSQESNDGDQDALVDDEAEEASDNEETQSTAADDPDEEMQEAPSLSNGRFRAVNGRKLPNRAGEEQDSDVDSIVQISKNAPSPRKKLYRGKQQRGKAKAQQAKDFRWPEEDSQSEAESETSALGIENFPR